MSPHAACTCANLNKLFTLSSFSSSDQRLVKQSQALHTTHPQHSTALYTDEGGGEEVDAEKDVGETVNEIKRHVATLSGMKMGVLAVETE